MARERKKLTPGLRLKLESVIKSVSFSVGFIADQDVASVGLLRPALRLGQPSSPLRKGELSSSSPHVKEN